MTPKNQERPVVAGEDSGPAKNVAASDANAEPHGEKEASAARLPREFGDYELLEEIGRGGQGVVFRAWQKSLNRTVAVKIIEIGQLTTSAHLKRLRREAEAAAKLNHPGIVPIYEVGERDGTYYFSMRFVEGDALDEVVDRGSMSVRQAAELIAKVARTVHYAHEHGILHRDIKPGNILLDANGEPHLLNRKIDRDLSAVCLKCLEKNPRYRYSSALELAEDLERWLWHEPIRAKRSGFFTHARKWVQRNPMIAALITLSVLLAAGLGVMTWERESVRRIPAGIAVLPFENLSDNKEDAFFADGVQDDILTKLAKIADLKVISRTSVMGYRGKRDLRQIGRSLGVSHVVEGTARRFGSKVHVNAQLVDTRTDIGVWADEYERDLNGAFAIPSEIAQKVAEELHAKISAAEKAAIRQPPTNDLAAYDLYVRAHNLLLTSFSSAARPKLLQAADLLDQAVARDPLFFQAYCQLAHTHGLLYLLGVDHTPERLAAMEAAVQAAFRLRPDAGEAHLARAENLYFGYLDYDGALAELELARRSLPNNPQVFAVQGYIQRRQGRWDESTRNLERAIDLDPRNFYMLQQIAISYGLLRRSAAETSVLRRASAIEPDDVNTTVALAAVQFHSKADTLPLHQTIDSIRATNPGALPNVANDWLSCALAERDVAEATNALNVFGEVPLTDYGVHANRPLIEGILARMTKDEGKARTAFTAARALQERAVQEEPDYGPPLCVLGLIDAGLGRKEEALREGRRAVELLPVEKDAINGPLMIKYLAMIAAWAGDKDLACEQLASVIRRPSSLSYGHLKLEPDWDPLRDDPRFEKIIASLAPK